MAALSIDQLLDSLGKAARGSHQSVINVKDLAELNRFAAHLVKSDGLAEGTAQVYKSLCAKALAQGPDASNPTMMSALRALARYRANL